MSIQGTWYRRGFIVPIPDTFTNQPTLTAGYFVRQLATPSERFLPPRFLFPNAPEKTSSPTVERCWFLSEQEARDAIDLYMDRNQWPEV